jgi:serine phosphatase RsbU (regulator of sigma subunit)
MAKWNAPKTNVQGVVRLRAADIVKPAGVGATPYWLGTMLPAAWKYHAGDNPLYASPTLDDAAWDTVATSLNAHSLQTQQPRSSEAKPNAAWNGIGWFRLHLRIDSTLRNKTLGLLMSQTGASSIYLNGKLICTVGVVAADAQQEQRYNPVFTPIPLPFDGDPEQVLAVRYSNTAAREMYSRYGTFASMAGFEMFVKDLSEAVNDDVEKTRIISISNLIAVGILSALTLLHALLYIFYPERRVNLFYSLFTATLAFRFWVIYAMGLSTNPDMMPLLHIAPVFYTTALIAFYAAFLYSTFLTEMPKRMWVIVACCLAYSLMLMMNYENKHFQWTWLLFMTVFSLEGVRVAFQAVRRKQAGAIILAIGTLDFAFMWFFRGIVDVVPVRVPSSLFDVILYIGYMSVPFSMSLYIARSFSQTNRSLTSQLAQVKELSERTLEQERLAREQEVRQRLLEADNNRKTQELEEARALQLSMLPRSVPEHQRFEFAAYMRTATEVGGDYYDFKLAPDGTLLAAVGDATGHGMKAGFLVSTAKSHVQTIAPQETNADALQRISRGIRNMNLRGMYMCLALVKLSHSHHHATSATNVSKTEATIAVAGMPPMLVYRAATRTVEKVILKALPLGSVSNASYQQATIELNDNDALLLMSDGLPELFNAANEMLGDTRIEEQFRLAAEHSADEIIKHLQHCADEWSNGAALHDDVTLVAVKVKPLAVPHDSMKALPTNGDANSNPSVHTPSRYEAVNETL